MHAMGYTIELSISPWSLAIKNLNEGTTDLLFPVGKNAERHKIHHYSDETINHANFLIYTNKSSHIDWQGLDSLKGMSICMLRDYNYCDI
jgi:polar amino acid transport system substrate-binding protein